MKPLAVVAGLVLAAIVVAVAVSTGGPAPAGSTGANGYPTAVVAGASAMTQQMAATTDDGHAYHPHAGDEQLRLSSDPAFLRQLAAYQAAVDRMLARTP